MISGAALCPSPPLLHPALTGRSEVVPELRAACASAVEWLLRDDPAVIVVVGTASATGEWDAGARLDVAAFGPVTGRRTGAERAGTERTGAGSPLPLSLGLGAMLLDQAGFGGTRRLLAVGQDEPASACAALGARLGAADGRTALLVMGDGSARRTLRAPGYLDPRAAGFDAEVERAVRDGELDALLRIDHDLARDLMATGRPAWQVLAGAMRDLGPVSDVLYCDAPFGVGYLVACLRPAPGSPG